MSGSGQGGKWTKYRETPKEEDAKADTHGVSEERKNKFLKDEKLLKITDEEIKEIEIKTRGQMENPEWVRQREIRITSSMFGKICLHQRFNKTVGDILDEKLNPRDLSAINAPMHGKRNELEVLRKFEEKTGIETQQCGMFVAKDHPYLGASPIAMIADLDACVEIKCPYGTRFAKVDEKLGFLERNRAGRLQMNKHHRFYYQVQGHLYCTNKKLCKYVIYATESRDMQILDVPRDDEFIAAMLKKVVDFYENHYKNALVRKYCTED